MSSQPAARSGRWVIRATGHHDVEHFDEAREHRYGEDDVLAPLCWRRSEWRRVRPSTCTEPEVSRIQLSRTPRPPLCAQRRSRLPVASAWGTGTTPACAGKTVNRPVNSLACWDHPRVRGENASSARRRPLNQGPPPRARGRHFLSRVFCHGCSSIDHLSGARTSIRWLP